MLASATCPRASESGTSSPSAHEPCPPRGHAMSHGPSPRLASHPAVGQPPDHPGQPVARAHRASRLASTHSSQRLAPSPGPPPALPMPPGARAAGRGDWEGREGCGCGSWRKKATRSAGRQMEKTMRWWSDCTANWAREVEQGAAPAQPGAGRCASCQRLDALTKRAGGRWRVSASRAPGRVRRGSRELARLRRPGTADRTPDGPETEPEREQEPVPVRDVRIRLRGPQEQPCAARRGFRAGPSALGSGSGRG